MQLSQIQSDHVRRLDAGLLAALISEGSCQSTAGVNQCTGIDACLESVLFPIKYKIPKIPKYKIPKSCTVPASVSQHAYLKRHLLVLWSLILCFSSQQCWWVVAHRSILHLCWASFVGFCSGRRRVACFFPQVQEASGSQRDILQPINQITSCDSIHLPLTSHLLISL